MIVTVVASVLLASAATFLKPYQDRNEELNVKKNILKAAGLVDETHHKYKAHEVLKIYDERIRENVIDLQGNPVNIKVADLDPKDESKLPIYFNMDGEILNGVILPVEGKGLWSTIYGYIALDPDMNTVKGMTFYKHGETPGLGGEVEKNWFTHNFAGKKIYEGDQLVSVAVAKGKLMEASDHKVDGISGATLTGKGVTRFLRDDLDKYKPWLDSHRKEVQ